jgi:ribosome-binding protein aMBF1 (putative translation factor)
MTKQNCMWCGKQCDGKNEIIIAGEGRWTVCGDCLNNYGNRKFSSLPPHIYTYMKELGFVDNV